MDLEQRNEAMNSLLSRISILVYADTALVEGRISLARSSIQYVAAELMIVACQNATIGSAKFIEDITMDLNKRYDDLDPKHMGTGDFIKGIEEIIEDCNAAHKKQQTESEGE